ncbi:MAG: hypothetical protein WBQ74_13360, partial [Candidatus Sulfotelmatobacter sp.]
LVQHQLPEMGHSDLLVTQTLYRQQCWGRPRGSVRRASGLVQTRSWSLTNDSGTISQPERREAVEEQSDIILAHNRHTG